MKLLGKRSVLGALAAGVLGLGVLSGCGGEEEAAADRDQLDELADTVDGLAAEIVPATEHAARSAVHSWQGDYRVCSDPTSTDVSYVVAAQLDAVVQPRAEVLRRLVTVFEDAGWEVASSHGAVLTATQDDVTATLTIGRASTDLNLGTDCVEVADDVGREYADRQLTDFLADR